MSEADLIQGSSVKCRTMADGTFRLEIDIEPSQAMQAFGLFGQPGAPVVLARLTQEAAQASMQKQAAEPEMKGGELAKWAGIFSGDGRFVHWAHAAHRELWDECFRVTDPIGDYAAVAAEFIRQTCGVQSRRELDHNKQAGLIFREQIMRPFNAWKEMGIDR